MAFRPLVQGIRSKGLSDYFFLATFFFVAFLATFLTAFLTVFFAVFLAATFFLVAFLATFLAVFFTAFLTVGFFLATTFFLVAFLATFFTAFFAAFLAGFASGTSGTTTSLAVGTDVLVAGEITVLLTVFESFSPGSVLTMVSPSVLGN